MPETNPTPTDQIENETVPQTLEDVANMAREEAENATSPVVGFVPVEGDLSHFEAIKERPGHYLDTITGDVVNIGYDITQPAPLPHFDLPIGYATGDGVGTLVCQWLRKDEFDEFCQALDARFDRMRDSFLGLRGDVDQVKADLLAHATTNAANQESLAQLTSLYEALKTKYANLEASLAPASTPIPEEVAAAPVTADEVPATDTTATADGKKK